MRSLGTQVTALVLLVSLVALVSYPAAGMIGSAAVTTPPVSTSTTFTPTSLSTLLTSSTTTSTSFSTTTSSTSTSTTTTSTSWSYTSTYSSTTTSTSTYTSYTSTVSGASSTFTEVTATSSTSTSSTTTSATTTVLPSISPSCPLALATTGTALEPYANFLRGFRNDQIQNTTAGRDFMQAFNGWYYGWAPSVSYTAASNSWLLSALRVGVYPLMGILYASYFSYTLVSPISTEAGAITAGVVAASLIGLVYVAPAAYLGYRLIRRRVRFTKFNRAGLVPVAGWVSAGALMIGAAYLAGSAWMMGLGTASLTLSLLTAGAILGTKAWMHIGLPVAYMRTMAFSVRRTIR